MLIYKYTHAFICLTVCFSVCLCVYVCACVCVFDSSFINDFAALHSIAGK